MAFENVVEATENYVKKVLPDGGSEIIRKGHNSGRVFKNPGDRCDCNRRKTELCQCPHEILNDDFVFHTSKFNYRWHY